LSTLENIAIVITTVIAMELFAWSVHKYVMHGWGWGWHRDHHEPHNKMLEKNDLFGVVFGSFAILLFLVGSLVSPFLWWVAMGATVYGIIYAFIHDGLVHQRFIRWVPKRGYAKQLVQAHKLHHATVGKRGGVSFGFVLARNPARLKAELKAQREAGIAVVRDADIG
jgi:beta-carotene 3-hydroxylase